MDKPLFSKFKVLTITLLLSFGNVIAESYWAGLYPGNPSWWGYPAPIGESTISHWGISTVGWYLNQNHAGDGLTFAQTQAAILNGYNQWDNVSTANIQFTFMGSTTIATWGNDGSNVHYWAEAEDPAFDQGGPLAGGHLAVAVVTINSSYEIIDADVVWNGRDITWSDNGNDFGDPYDIWANATHEIGHTIGLHHPRPEDIIPGSADPTMYGNYGLYQRDLA
jgi:hypothetical protein